MSDTNRNLMALLYVAGQPLEEAQLCSLLSLTPEQLQPAIRHLEETLPDGLILQRHNTTVQLATDPAADAIISAYLQAEAKTELTRPAMETLAIVAYRGPISRQGIEEIRGVSSDAMIRNLLQRGLLAESGHTTGPERSVLYCVSHDFLQHFGLKSLKELPDLPEVPHED